MERLLHHQVGLLTRPAAPAAARRASSTTAQVVGLTGMGGKAAYTRRVSV